MERAINALVEEIFDTSTFLYIFKNICFHTIIWKLLVIVEYLPKVISWIPPNVPYVIISLEILIGRAVEIFQYWILAIWILDFL